MKILIPFSLFPKLPPYMFSSSLSWLFTSRRCPSTNAPTDVPSNLLQQQHLLVQHAKQALDFLSNNLELFGHLTCDQGVRV